MFDERRSGALQVRELQGGEARYRAFVSYSHRDRVFGRRLHGQLERYVLPRRLVGRVTAQGPAPRRLTPVFRDREELSAAHDLTSEIRHALAHSDALIVVCSPNSAASPWVTREIELFRELHPDRPVLAALIAGEPRDAFPEALTHARTGLIEPLAADFRAEGDGPRLALLKLVAGVLGLGVDELIQRDAQRRLRNVMAVTGAAFAAVLAMALLTTVAVTSRLEAERQRAEAERQRLVAERQTVEALKQSEEARRQRGVALANGAEADRQSAEAQRQRAEAEELVEFMLTDLRDRLKGVGRLDVLTAVNDRTLAYYAGQDVARMPAESQMRYARTLHALVEDEITRGAAAAAGGKLKVAKQITARLRARAPDDPQRIWTDGQSDYLLGFAAYRAGTRADAEAHWERRRALFRRLVELEPGKPAHRRELAYAEGDLCALALRVNEPGKPVELAQPKKALPLCDAALRDMQIVARLSPKAPGLTQDLSNRHAWMANALGADRNLDGAYAQRKAQERLLDEELRTDPKNMRLRKAWVVAQKELASIEVGLRRPEQAQARLEKAHELLTELLAFDPENAEWAMQRDRFQVALSYFQKK